MESTNQITPEQQKLLDQVQQATQGMSQEQMQAMMAQLNFQGQNQAPAKQAPATQQKKPSTNPEESKNEADDGKQLVKGMRELEQKNIIVNLQSNKYSWNDLQVPDDIKHVLEDMKMDKPSIIQSISIPKILEKSDQNFLFQASNGSGKTLAFGIPSIMRVDPEINGVQVLIIANTRELIRQVQQVLAKVSSKTKVQVIIGDQETKDSAAHIVVTVPKWIENRLSGRKPLDLKNLKLIVYDEADEIFQQEANHQSIAKIMTHLDQTLGISPQTVLFSATFQETVMKNINMFFKQLSLFTTSVEAMKLKGVKQFRLKIAEKDKNQFISDVYNEMDVYQTMIFVNKKEDAVKLQDKLTKMGISAEKLIGGIDQKQRDKIIDDFRKTITTSLISTNVLARGIDVPEVDLVINYDVPYISQFGFKNPDYANYLHRVGRTGRFGTDGVAVTLVSEEDEVYDDLVDQIQSYYKIEIGGLKDLEHLKSILLDMRGDN